MNLTQARALVRQFGRNSGDSSMYSDADVDRAIQAAADKFLQITRTTRQTDNLALTADDSTFTAANITNFRSERLLRAWIPDKGELEIISHQALMDFQIGTPKTAVPNLLAFTSWSVGEVYPTPGDDFAAKLLWLPPFTVFTAGTSTDPGTLNIPDDWLRTMLMYGATATLQHNEPEHLYSDHTFQKFLEFCNSLRGGGGDGAKAILRDSE